MDQPLLPPGHAHHFQLAPEIVHAVLETAGAVIILVERTGKVAYLNPAGQRLTGYALDDVRGRPFWEVFLLPAEATQVRKVFDDLCAGHFPNTFQNHWRTRWGRVRLLTWANTALTDGEGAVAFVLGIGIDVTDEREADQRFRLLFNAATVPIALADAERRIISCNPAFERFVGYSERELRASTFPLATHPDDAAGDMELYQALARGERSSYTLVKRYICKDKAIRWARLTVIAVPSTTGVLAHTIGLVEEITALKDLEMQLAELGRQLSALRLQLAQQAEDLAHLRFGITRMEWRVLQLLAEGLTNVQIADRLSKGTSTVKSHVHHLHEKLGVAERHKLVALARSWIDGQASPRQWASKGPDDEKPTRSGEEFHPVAD